MSFWIRQATNRDTEAIVNVIRTSYDEYGWTWEPTGYHADLYDIEAQYWRPGHGFWVAESIDSEANVLGTVGLLFFQAIPLGENSITDYGSQIRITGADCSLERLYVHPEARGKGMGSALLDHAMAVARSVGKRRMEIWSDKKLEAAHRLYRKFGALEAGERICHDPDQSPEWGMVLPLVHLEI